MSDEGSIGSGVGQVWGSEWQGRALQMFARRLGKVHEGLRGTRAPEKDLRRAGCGTLERWTFARSVDLNL